MARVLRRGTDGDGAAPPTLLAMLVSRRDPRQLRQSPFCGAIRTSRSALAIWSDRDSIIASWRSTYDGRPNPYLRLSGTGARFKKGDDPCSQSIRGRQANSLGGLSDFDPQHCQVQ
jgi:hypothetical protein